MPEGLQSMCTTGKEEELQRGHRQSAPLAGGERVAKHDAGHQNGQELPRGHDGRKDQRAEVPDGVHDEELACSMHAHTCLALLPA